MDKKYQTALLFSIPLFILIGLTIYFTDGHFTYSLDDPYIHLALAENIFHGHYGINKNEPSAPSSSIIWPFILAIFYPAGKLFHFVPLLLNSICCIGSCIILHDSLRFLRKCWQRALLCFVFAFSLNLFGLTLTGMENSLQVFLSLFIGKRIFEFKYDGLLFLALLTLPLVRYEGFAISLPVLLYLFFKGEKRTSILIALILILLVGSFSFYILSKGLSILPSSVLAKTSKLDYYNIALNFRENLRQFGYVGIVVVLIIQQVWAKDRYLAASFLMSCLLFFLFGKTGLFSRYEIFILSYILLASVYFLLKNDPTKWKVFLSIPIPLFFVLQSTILTPPAASNIYRQHIQMGRITSLLNEPVAVNDLGAVSYYTPHYVLDLWGLGSIEALQLRESNKISSNWIEHLMGKNHVQFAMIYDDWFTNLPAHWIKVGKLNLDEKLRSSGKNTISLYATDKSSAATFRTVLIRYKKEGMPTRTTLDIFPE